MGLTALAAAFFLAFGLWAYFDARSFFDGVATFEPYNEHFLHDIGAFQIGLGVGLATAIWRPTDAILVALIGAGVGSAFHAAAHLRDHDLGGKDIDAFIFGLVAVLLLAGAAVRLSSKPSPSS